MTPALPELPMPPLDCTREELLAFFDTLQEGDRVIERGVSGMQGETGTIIFYKERKSVRWDTKFKEGTGMVTSLTGGLRRLEVRASDVAPEKRSMTPVGRTSVSALVDHLFVAPAEPSLDTPEAKRISDNAENERLRLKYFTTPAQKEDRETSLTRERDAALQRAEAAERELSRVNNSIVVIASGQDETTVRGPHKSVAEMNARMLRSWYEDEQKRAGDAETKLEAAERRAGVPFTAEERDYLLSFIRHDLSERTSVNGSFDQSVPWGDGNFMRRSLIERLEALAAKEQPTPPQGDE